MAEFSPLLNECRGGENFLGVVKRKWVKLLALKHGKTRKNPAQIPNSLFRLYVWVYRLPSCYTVR